MTETPYKHKLDTEQGQIATCWPTEKEEPFQSVPFIEQNMVISLELLKAMDIRSFLWVEQAVIGSNPLELKK